MGGALERLDRAQRLALLAGSTAALWVVGRAIDAGQSHASTVGVAGLVAPSMLERSPLLWAALWLALIWLGCSVATCVLARGRVVAAGLAASLVVVGRTVESIGSPRQGWLNVNATAGTALYGPHGTLTRSPLLWAGLWLVLVAAWTVVAIRLLAPSAAQRTVERS